MSKNKRRCCYSKAAIAVLSTGIRKPCQLFYDTLDRIEKHSKDVQLKQSTLDEAYNRRSGVERTNESVKGCDLGYTHARGCVHAQAQVFLALCLRLVVAITNYEQEDNPGSTVITV